MRYCVVVEEFKEVFTIEINDRTVPMERHLLEIQSFMKKHDNEASYTITTIDKNIKIN